MITKKYKNPAMPENFHPGWSPMRFGKGVVATPSAQTTALPTAVPASPCSYSENSNEVCAMCKYGSPIDAGFVCLAPKLDYTGNVKGLELDADEVGAAEVDTWVLPEGLPLSVPLGTVTTSPTLTRLELRSEFAPLPMLGEFSPQEERELRRLDKLTTDIMPTRNYRRRWREE